MRKFFHKNANRVCIIFDGIGMVPIVSDIDDKPEFETTPPRRIGDDAVVFVEGKRRMVRLLKSKRTSKNGTYLVDMGPAR